MTLIAAFEVKKTPVLIGDLMLSQLGVEKIHSKLPTYDDPSQILPIDWQRNISGLHRKVCIVHPNVVVGWTGRLIYSSHVIYKLIRLLKRHKIIDKTLLSHALQQCQESLRDYTEKNTIDSDELTVIGWLITQDLRYFKFEWTCQSFQFSENQPIIASGSGASKLEEILNDTRTLWSGNANDDQTDVAIECVAVVSMLLGIEVSTGSNILQLYGGGYDIVILVDGQFRFLNDILYVPIFIYDLEKLHARVQQPTIFFKYYYVEGNLAIARKVMTHDKDGVIEKDEVTISVIGEFGTHRKRLEELKIETQYKFESSIVALIFLAKLENGHIVHAPMVVTGKSDFVKFHKNIFAINMKIFKMIFPDLTRLLEKEYK